MKEEKKTFKEKWQDKKYQAKFKLSGYGIFVLIVILMLSIGGRTNNNDTNYDNNINDNEQNDNNNEEEKENKVMFNKPNKKSYTYEIKITTKENNIESNYYYHGNVYEAYEEIIKQIDNISYRYRIKDDKYFTLKNEKYILTTKEEVYDIISYDYLNIDNINNYLSYSKLINNNYRIYLKDIILNVNTDDYIESIIKEDSITIDYTKLINYLESKTYDSYIVEIKYNE